jgi:multidrug efflux system outer membrane protein
MVSRSLALAAFLALVGSCKLGPDYARPEIEMPAGWRELSAPEAQSLADTPWWELFGDPALQELIRIALAENKDLAIAVERIEEARARWGFTRADLYPRVDASASAGRTRLSQNGLQTGGAEIEDSLYSVGATAFWELDVFGRISRATEAELELLYATEETRRAVVLALVSAVAQAYVELRDFDQRLAIAQRTLQSRVEYVDLARVRFEGGLTSELDWRQAEAELHRTAGLVHQFELLVAQKENELAVLLGRNPGPIARGLEIGALPLPLEVPSGLPAELLDRRPDLLSAEHELASANARIGEAKALLYPSFALTGSFGWESTELGDLLDAPSRTWSFGANVLQPIFNAGQNRRRVEVSESQQRQALYSYEQSILIALREVEDALVGYRKSGERRGTDELRVEAELKVLELAELRYRGGVADYLEVLESQRSLFDAELSASETSRDQIVSLIQLYRALGGGWPTEPEQAAEQPAPAVP